MRKQKTMNNRDRFFNKKFDFLTLDRVIEITGAQVIDTGATIVSERELKTKISDVSTLGSANESEISFLNSSKYLDKFLSSRAGFCFVEEKNRERANNGKTLLLTHRNPYFAHAKIVASFYEEKSDNFLTDSLVAKTAVIGENTRIAPNAYVGEGVIIGKNCYIGPSVSIMSRCIIGDNCIINAGAVVSFAVLGSNCIIHNGVKIGQDGFGFVHDSGINHKIVQIGIVRIGNSVEIGANSCVDRGAIEDTVIGDDTKIDNLVQIAHNVVVGCGTVIAGCTAIAGSAKIGNFVQVGGGANIAGHITIGDGVKIAGMTGVMRDIEPMQIVAGIPSVPIRKWHKANAMLAKMTNAVG